MKNLLMVVVLLILTISATCQVRKSWEAAKSSNTTESYKKFLSDYPDCRFSNEAQQELNKLEKQEFIILVQNNKNKIKNGMTYEQLDSFLLLSKFSPFSKSAFGTKTGGIVANITSSLVLKDYLTLKFENGKLKEWFINK